MVAAAASTTTTTTDHSNPKESTTNHCQRPPLLPSERDNGVGVGVSTRRPKSKEVTSRYLSSSSSISSSYSSSSTNSSSSNNSSFRRLPSPSPSRVVPATPTPLKRSQSVERRRPGTPGVVTGTPVPDWRARIGTPHLSTAAKVLSSRSLSVSFQGESYSLPISKTKAVAPTPQQSNVRKGTPERRRVSPMPTPLRGGGDHMENSKPVDQHRWPGSRPRQVNLLSKSLDCSVEKGSKVVGSGKVVRSLLQQSMIDDSRRASFDGRLNPDLSNAELIQSIQVAVDADTTANGSDSDSRSSGSNECGNGGITRGRSTPRGSISVSARFWQETNSRMRGLMEPRSPMSNTTSSRSIAQPKLIPKKSFGDTALSSPRNVSISRTLSSPLRGPVRPASPSKSMPSSASSPSRGNASPSRVRNGMATPVGGSQLCNTPSVLCFPADILRRKVEDNRVVDAHLLRLFYNRNLQWCFVNARADAAMLTQRLTAEKNLYSAWTITSELRDSVRLKRIKLQSLRQNLKLASVLKGQMTYLEEWTHLDKDHSCSLSGAIEALKASTLRLPVVGGARADIQNVKEAVSSAVDVMQAMASSICFLLSKVEEVNTFVVELANVTVQERAMLEQCKDILSTIAAMQVEDSSLRTHILQLKRIQTRSLTSQV